MPGFLVIPPGFEPGTHSLEGCCSIQLSYGTVPLFGGTKVQIIFYLASRNFSTLSNTTSSGLTFT